MTNTKWVKRPLWERKQLYLAHLNKLANDLQFWLNEYAELIK